MILLIDAGNTRAKFAWLATGETVRSTPPQSLEYADLSALADQSLDTPQHILGSNVAGADVARTLAQACHQRWHLNIEWCNAQDGQTLLRNPYAQPDKLGSDRWLGLLGILQRVRHDSAWLAGTPCILANFGTATTVDTLLHQTSADDAPNAVFLGGLILPGATLMARSLAAGTAQLPLAGGASDTFPTETHAAIASGIAAAQGGALLRQWRLAQQIGGRAPQVFVAGGGWPTVCDEICRMLTQAQADLGLPPCAPQWLDGPVLDGLACLAQQPGFLR